MVGRDQLLARDDRAPLHGHAPPALAAVGQHLAARRRAPRLHLVGVGPLAQQLQLQQRGLTDQALQLLGILEPRHLDQDALRPLPDHRGFARSVRIDPSTQDVHGGVQRLIDDQRLPRGRGLQHDPVLIDQRQVELARAREPRAAHERQQPLARRIP